MSDDIQSKLNLAYEQVEAGQLDDAIATLDPILAADPNNADAWWIYTHASQNPQEARRALENVIRIDPAYPGAQDLIEVLNQDFPVAPAEPAPRPTIRSIAPPPPMPEAPPSMPEPPRTPRTFDPVSPAQSAMNDVFDTPVAAGRPAMAEPAPQERSGTSTATIVIFAVVVTAIIIALLLLNPGGDTPASDITPTAIAGVDVTATDAAPQIAVTDETTPEGVSTAVTPDVTLTEEATAEATPVEAASPEVSATAETETAAAPDETATETPEVVAAVTSEPTATEEPTATSTEEAATQEATEQVDLSIPDALTVYTLAEAGLTAETLEIGTANIINICSAPGAAARALLREAMEAFAGAVEEATPSADAIGVRLVNCDTGATLVAVAAPRADAEAFASGSLPAADFARTWVAVR